MIKQLFSIGIALSLFSQMLWAQWTPVGDRIKTSWAENRCEQCITGISASYYGAF